MLFHTASIRVDQIVRHNSLEEMLKKAQVNKTGDESVDINSNSVHELPPTVAALIKNEKSDTIFNGHAGLKAKNINIEAELEGKNVDEWVFARVRAIDACGFERKAHAVPPEGNNEDLNSGANDNGDYFSVEELLRERSHEGKTVRAYETFVGVPFFTNHQNQDVEQARGKIVNAFYDLDQQTVFCDIMVDAKSYGPLARGIKEGYIKDVSMGTAVEYSLCSVCANKASTPDQYCTHIRNHKGKKFGGKKVYEINHGLKFIEISAVTDGACENCKVEAILNPEDLKACTLKAANVANGLVRMANQNKASLNPDLQDALAWYNGAEALVRFWNFKRATNGSLVKVASKEDLQALYEALQQLKKVTVKIINSEEVDYEFVEDIAKVLASLQNLIVDLAEAGFGDIQDGGQPQDGSGGGAGLGDMLDGGQAGGDPNAAGGDPAAGGAMGADPAGAAPGMDQGFKQQPPNPTQEMGLAAGTSRDIEKTAYTHDSINRELSDFLETFKSIKASTNNNKSVPNQSRTQNNDYLALKQKVAQNWNKLMSKETSRMNRSNIEVSNGDFTVKIANNKVIGIYADATNFETEISALHPSLVAEYKENPYATAQKILQAWSKGDSLSAVAYHKNPPPVEQVQEGQVNDLDGNFSRVRPVHDADLPTTEKQLQEDWKLSAETGSTEIKLDGKVVDQGETRFDAKNFAEGAPTTEKQLAESKKRIQDAQAEASYGTTESQLKTEESKFDFNRWDHGQRDNRVPVTEGQLKGESSDQPASKERLGYAVDELQEGQLKAKRQGPDAYMSSQAGALETLVKAAASVVLEKGLSPAQVAESFTAIDKQYAGVFKQYAGVIRDKNSVANLIGRLRTASTNKELSKQDIVRFVMDRVAEKHIYNPASYNAETIATANSVLAENPLKAEAAIKKAVDIELNRISEAASGKTVFEVKEHNVKSALNNALSKLAGEEDVYAESYGVEFSAEDVSTVDSRSAQFAHDVKELAANVLTENGVAAVAENVSIVKVARRSEGLYVAEVKVARPTDSQVKLAFLKGALRKQAQTAPQGSQFGDPSGGMGDMGGGAPNPAAPGGIGAMSTPPPDMGGAPEMEDAPMDDTDGSPKFPGEVCPVCGQSDIESMDDSFVCKNCDSEFKVNVDISILNVDKALGKGTSDDDMGAPEGMEDDPMGGDGTDMAPVAQPAPGMPPAGAPPAPMGAGIPTQASVSVHPSLMVRTANYLGRLAFAGEACAPGQRCPQCGSSKTNLSDCNGLCIACGTDYKVTVARNDERQDLVDVTIDYLATSKKYDVRKCKSCAGAVRKFDTKVASLKSNQEKLYRLASTVSEENSFSACIQKYVEDGYTRRASVHIAGATKASLELEEMQKTAQQAMPGQRPSAPRPQAPAGKPVSGRPEFAKPEDDMLEDNVDEMNPEQNDSNGGDLSNPMNSIPSLGEGDDEFSLEGDDFGDDAGDDFGGDVIEDDYSPEGGFMEGTDGSKLTVKIDVQPEGESDLGGSGCADCGSESFDDMSGTCPDCGAEDNGGDDMFGGDDLGSDDLGGGNSIELTIDTETGAVEVSTEGEFGDDEFGGDDLGFDDEFGGEEDSDIVDTDGGDDFGDSVSPEDEAGEGDFGGDDEASEAPVEESPEEEDDIVQESDEEDARPAGAFAMSGNMVQSAGKLGGNNLDINYIRKALNLSQDQVKAEAQRLAGVHPFFRTASNPKLTKTANILGSVKLAQSQERAQTMPLNHDDDVDIPRDESVGLKQTEPKEVVKIKNDKYELGKNRGQETDEVPRDSSGDGIGGKKVEFEAESGDKQTSGNPDNYVQTLVEQIDSTPAGDKKNHATVANLHSKIRTIVAKHDLDTKALELADAKQFYILACNEMMFKLPKVAGQQKSIDESLRFKFAKWVVDVDTDGSISKTRVASSEEGESPSKSSKPASGAGNSVKPNKPDGKKNHAITPVNQGVNTASSDDEIVAEASEERIVPNKPDGKKNKAITPTNKGVNTAGSDDIIVTASDDSSDEGESEGSSKGAPNAGSHIKPQSPDGKKNHGITPVNKGVNTAGKKKGEPFGGKAAPLFKKKGEEDSDESDKEASCDEPMTAKKGKGKGKAGNEIKPTPVSDEDNKLAPAGKYSSVETKAIKLVASKKGIDPSRLEAKEAGNYVVVAHKDSTYVAKLKKK